MGVPPPLPCGMNHWALLCVLNTVSVGHSKLVSICCSPDDQDLSDLLLRVRLCGDDEETVQQVYGNSVRTGVVGTSDPKHTHTCTHNKIQIIVCVCVCVCVRARARSLGDSPVGGHDEYGGHVTLQGSVQEGEALDVQHVHLINEQHLHPPAHTHAEKHN